MQHDLLANGTRMNPIITKINTLWDREEKYWHKKSCISWLKARDVNSKIFHFMGDDVTQLTAYKMRMGDGAWMRLVRAEPLINILRSFLLLMGHMNHDMESVLSCLDGGINEEMNDALLSPISLQEVKNVVYDMRALKGPGPDGFQGVFYQKLGSKST